VQNTAAFFQRQLSITGLHEPVRKEIMKWTYDNFQAIYEATLDFEVIQQDNAATKPITVAAIKETPLLVQTIKTTKSRPSMLFRLATDSLSFPSHKMEELPAALPLQMGHPAPMEPMAIPDPTGLTQTPTSSATTARNRDTSKRTASDKGRMVPPWWTLKENPIRTRAWYSASFSLMLLHTYI
jgi:hypothetical protein